VIESRGVRLLLRLATALVLAFLYLPLIVLAIYAFNPSRSQVWPPVGFTLSWFGEALASSTLINALVNSVVVALAATAIALVLGTLAALAVQRFSFFGRQTISFFLVLPIALPGVVTGIALRTTFVTVGIDFGLLTIVVGHATFCVVIAYNNVVARLRRLSVTPEEASSDLGADSFTTFRRVTLPGMRTALLSGALLAFGLSFDEIIVTNFTAGAGTQTIPMWILAAIQRPQELPVVNVVALVLVLVSVVPVWLASRISSDDGALGRA
jgi:putative spermidine/putrescine transport system permease protein